MGVAILNGTAPGVSIEGKILLKTTHVWIGYVFALNLLWRLIWAFIGGQYARWRVRKAHFGHSAVCGIAMHFKLPMISGTPTLKNYYTGDTNLRKKLAQWEDYYNFLRPHFSHKGKTPYEKLKQCMLDEISLSA